MPSPSKEGVLGEKSKRSPAPLRPSSSILLLSPTNQVLLLARVQTSTSFASAHVFPGGNLSSFHDGPLPSPDDPAYHEDGPAYRLAAIRETFEESGILLARKLGQSRDQGMLHVPDDVREAGRTLVHANQVRFTDWLREQGGEPDVDNLIPFTRWITPPGPPKRFTTQMYLYLLPATHPAPGAARGLVRTNRAVIPTPTHDGGIEHTAAAFDDARAWLDRARAGAVILFPPQFYLLHLLAEQFADLGVPKPPTATATTGQERDRGNSDEQRDDDDDDEIHEAQRAALLAFLRRTPTSARHPRQPTSAIPWPDKVMSPSVMLVRQGDGRVVLGLDGPGAELRGSGRGGDWERVVLVRFDGGGPRELEVCAREEVLAGEREGGNYKL